MTKEQTQNPSLSLFLAVEGNHSRDHTNLRQDEIIKNEVLPTLKTEEKDIGIITPYKNNVSKLKEMLDPDITISTIHNFQGRELDTIIFATSDDTVTDFSDDSALVNDLQDKPEGLDVSVLPIGSVSGLPVAPHPYG